MDYQELLNYLKQEDQKIAQLLLKMMESIEFGKELRGKQKVSIVTTDGASSSYLIPKGKHINFNQGEKIKKGEYLLDGSPAPHDI